MPAKVHNLCKTVLQDWIPVFQVAMNEALTPNARHKPCGRQECVLTSIGALVTGLHDAGLYAAPASTETMSGSLMWYWKALLNLGSELEPWKPCNEDKSGTWASCSFDLCIGTFRVVYQTEQVLLRHMHSNVMSNLRYGEQVIVRSSWYTPGSCVKYVEILRTWIKYDPEYKEKRGPGASRQGCR